MRSQLFNRVVCFCGLVFLALPEVGCQRREREEGENPAANLRFMAKEITSAMRGAERLIETLVDSIQEAYHAPKKQQAGPENDSEYVLASNGVLYRPRAVEDGVPAVFVSGAVPVDEAIIEVVRRTQGMDFALMESINTELGVVQAYFNDRNSYNRIYPPFDVLSQYPAGMPIPDYNFYYLADEAHNPERKTVWVSEPYVDPAGRGWMVSCIAPVYVDDQLEGVAGLDITVEAIVNSFGFEGKASNCILLSRDGTVVAISPRMAELLRLPALKSHRYVDTVREDTFRPTDFNLLKNRSSEIRRLAEKVLSEKAEVAVLDMGESSWTVEVLNLPDLEWLLLGFEKHR